MMTADIEKLIDRISELVGIGGSVDDFIPVIKDLVTAAPFSLGSTYEPGVPLYRATNHHRAVPETLSDLLSPPPEITRLGRANTAANPRFYCTSDPNCAYREIRVSPGQIVVHARWVTTAPMLLHDLGYTAGAFAYLGTQRQLPDRHQQFYNTDLTDRDRRVRDYLAEAFTDRDEARYALTAAIAEVHMQAPEFTGLLYPSVVKVGEVDNLALRPEFAKTDMRLESAQVVMVDLVTPDGSIGGVVLCDLAGVADGRLIWKFREEGRPLPPGGLMAVAAGDRLRVQSSGEIRVGDGRRYRVEPGYLIEVSDGELIVRNLKGLIEPPLT
jgi:hypothetical protein